MPEIADEKIVSIAEMSEQDVDDEEGSDKLAELVASYPFLATDNDEDGIRECLKIEDIQERKAAAFKISAIEEVTNLDEMKKCFDRHFLPMEPRRNVGRVIKVTHGDSKNVGIVVLSAKLADEKRSPDEWYQWIYQGLSCLYHPVQKDPTASITHYSLRAMDQFFMASNVHPNGFKGMYMMISDSQFCRGVSFGFRESCSYVTGSSLTGFWAPISKKAIEAEDEKYFPVAQIKLDPQLLNPRSESVKRVIHDWHAENEKFSEEYSALVNSCIADPLKLSALLQTKPEFSWQLKPADVNEIISTLWSGHRFADDEKQDIARLRTVAKIFLTAVDETLALKYSLDYWLNMAKQDAEIMRLVFANKGLGCEINGDTFREVMNTGKQQLIQAMLDGFPEQRYSFLHMCVEDMLSTGHWPAAREVFSRHLAYQKFLQDQERERASRIALLSPASPALWAASDAKRERRAEAETAKVTVTP